MITFTDAYWYLGGLAIAGLIVFTWFYYRRTVPPLSKAWRIGLGLSRAIALFLLFWALAWCKKS